MQLFTRISTRPGVDTQPSAISVPGARAFVVERAEGAPLDAFLVPRAGEFAHLHPGYDGSLHLTLPPSLAAERAGQALGGRTPVGRSPAGTWLRARLRPP